MSEIKVIGSINKICPRCDKDARCISFMIEGKTELLCEECLLSKYDFIIGSENKKGIFREFCNHCKDYTMERQNANTIVNDTHVIHKYVCSECHRSMNKEIKKWRKNERTK